MDETVYQVWWQLHLRVASRETLTPEEQIAYETGLRQLHREETLHSGDADDLRTLQAQIAESERERARLREQRQQIETKIAALETLRAQTQSAVRT